MKNRGEFMYCENCGHKLNDGDLFCEECGSKTKVISNAQVNKGSNKTLWIVLGCVFGGIFIFGIFLILLGVVFYSTVTENITEYDERIEDYIEDYDNVSIDSV